MSESIANPSEASPHNEAQLGGSMAAGLPSDATALADALQIDTTTTSASASASELPAPLTSPTEATVASQFRELKTSGGFGASASADQTVSSADNSCGVGSASASASAADRRMLHSSQQQQFPQQFEQYGGTPTSAALGPSSSMLYQPQQPQPTEAASQAAVPPQQWTVEENGVRVQLTSHQATDGTMTLTLPSGAVVTLQAAPKAAHAPAQQQLAQTQMQMQPNMQAQSNQMSMQPRQAQCPPSHDPSTAEHSMGFLPLGTFQFQGPAGGQQQSIDQTPDGTIDGGPNEPNNDHHTARIANNNAGQDNTVDDMMRVPFVPSLYTSAASSTGSAGCRTTAEADSVRYIDPMSSRIQVGTDSGGGGGDVDGGGGGENSDEDGKVAAAAEQQQSSDEEEIPQVLSNVDSADAAAGDGNGSPRKKKAEEQQQQQPRRHQRKPSSSSRSMGSQTIQGEQVTILRAHGLPNSSVIISSREGSLVEEQHDVEVLHKSLSVSSGSNSNNTHSNCHSNGSKSWGSKMSMSSTRSDPDLAAGTGTPPKTEPESEFARQSGDENTNVHVPQESSSAVGPIDEEALAATPQAKPTSTTPKKEEYKPLWLKAREEGREEETPASDPNKVYFVMNKQSNRKTEYYVSSGKDLPGLPHKDSAETDKPPSQIAMEENLRRAHKEASEAAALQQQQLEELAYLREMQRRHAQLEGQYIYHDDDQTEVSELTMGVHELGIGPPIAHIAVNSQAGGEDIDHLPDLQGGGQYSQSVDWNNLSEEQKKQISSDMASRNGGAVGLPDNTLETMVNMFTPELCHKAEPTRRIVRSLGALQPLHSTRSINMYQHTRGGGRGRVVGRTAGGVYRPAAAAASSAMPSINDVDYPASPKSSNGLTSSGGSTGDTNSTTSQRKIAKPVSPLKSLKSVRGLHGGIN